MFKRKKITQTYINSNPATIASDEANVQSEEMNSYHLFDKRFLHLGDNIDFNLYYHDKPTQMSLFLQSDTVIDKNKKKKLQEIEHLYIPHSEYRKYESFVEENLQVILEDETLSMDEKTEIIYTSSTDLTHSLFDNPNALENVQHSKKIVTPILQSIIHNNNTVASYLKIIEHDYYTHTHSLNVSIYAICLGAEMGLAENILADLGQAALLHDLGKSQIKYEIINKDGALSEAEFHEMKKHSELGYEIAISIGIDNQDILDAIRHHHEKLDGMGYPDNLRQNEIKMFARIIGVCDVFDALTTKRSYKAAMSSFDALMIMKHDMKTHLDMKIVNTFIKMLHK